MAGSGPQRAGELGADCRGWCVQRGEARDQVQPPPRPLRHTAALPAQTAATPPAGQPQLQLRGARHLALGGRQGVPGVVRMFLSSPVHTYLIISSHHISENIGLPYPVLNRNLQPAPRIFKKE